MKNYYEKMKKEAQAKAMTTHELARILLKNEDLPIATHANNHTYMSKADAFTHGKVRIGVLETYSGPHVVIGNFSRTDLNSPNWYVSKLIHGDL